MLLPEAIWDLLPPKARYIKNVALLCGYETVDAVSKLKDDGELTKMFNFAKSMADLVPNKEEMFGVFCSAPERLALLPGHKVCNLHL